MCVIDAGVKTMLDDPALSAEVINSIDKDGRSAFHYGCLPATSALLLCAALRRKQEREKGRERERERERERACTASLRGFGGLNNRERARARERESE